MNEIKKYFEEAKQKRIEVRREEKENPPLPFMLMHPLVFIIATLFLLGGLNSILGLNNHDAFINGVTVAFNQNLGNAGDGIVFLTEVIYSLGESYPIVAILVYLYIFYLMFWKYGFKLLLVLYIRSNLVVLEMINSYQSRHPKKSSPRRKPKS